MKRRSFLTALAGVPILGRLFVRESARANIPNECVYAEYTRVQISRKKNGWVITSGENAGKLITFAMWKPPPAQEQGQTSPPKD